MKFLFIFAVLIASMGANVAQAKKARVDDRFLDIIVINIINDLRETIRGSGLDPLAINREAGQFALAVPEIFTATGFVENLFFTGLSDIRIINMNYSILLFRLTYDIELPRLHIGVGYAYGEVAGFGEKGEGSISGSVDIENLRFAGQIRVQVGLSGISLRELEINLTLGGVNSAIAKLEAFEYDLAELVNNLLGVTIPETISNYRLEINELLELLLRDIVEGILN